MQRGSAMGRCGGAERLGGEWHRDAAVWLRKYRLLSLEYRV
jgi:hypothetical protein